MSWGFAKYRDYFAMCGAVDMEKGKPGLGKNPGTRIHCNLTYARNIGVQPKNCDIGRLDPVEYREELKIKKGDLTVLISCAPCTGFSQKKASNHLEDDPQNTLVEHSGDFVAEFLPEFFVMENVKELIDGKQKHHFVALRDRLESLGYNMHFQNYNFADYGVPQNRVRALVLARRDGERIAGLWRKQARRSVRDAIGHLPRIEQGEKHFEDPMHVCPKHNAHGTERMRAIPHDGGSWSDIPQRLDHLLIPSMRRRRAGSFPDIYGRMWWDRPAPTITRECGHPGNGRYTHPEQDRMLSVREMALLQGFPSDYVFEGPLSAKYNQIGDAVPPAISEQLAEVIVKLKLGESLPVCEGTQLRLSLPSNR
jgi:DNA (cytosine-5)-methyltransferase 1